VGRSAEKLPNGKVQYRDANKVYIMLPTDLALLQVRFGTREGARERERARESVREHERAEESERVRERARESWRERERARGSERES